MKQYRLFHRVRKEFTDVSANSAQEACKMAGWLIGDVWVRELTQGPHAHGWSNVTPKEVKPCIAQ